MMYKGLYHVLSLCPRPLIPWLRLGTKSRMVRFGFKLDAMHGPQVKVICVAPPLRQMVPCISWQRWRETLMDRLANDFVMKIRSCSPEVEACSLGLRHVYSSYIWPYAVFFRPTVGHLTVVFCSVRKTWQGIQENLNNAIVYHVIEHYVFLFMGHILLLLWTTQLHLKQNDIQRVSI